MKMNVKNFGGWAIDKECFNKIIELLPAGSTILEFGSGSGSDELSKYYKVYSVEHDMNWLNKYNTNYIYAPLKKIKENELINWYDVDILKQKLPKSYDLILIDGPPGNSSRNHDGRMGFIYNLDLFNLDDVIVIFDDLHRKIDYYNMMLFIKKTNRKYEIFNSGSDKPKKFGVVYP